MAAVSQAGVGGQNTFPPFPESVILVLNHAENLEGFAAPTNARALGPRIVYQSSGRAVPVGWEHHDDRECNPCAAVTFWGAH